MRLNRKISTETHRKMKGEFVMELFEIMKTRKSTRSYEVKQIEEKDLNEILLAGAAAPIGMRKYESVHLTVVQDAELLQELKKDAIEAWGRPEANPMYDAPTLIMVSCPSLNEERIEVANAACVVTNMALAATALGLGNIYLWGITSYVANNAEWLNKLQIPEDFRPISALAVGYATEELKSEKPWEQLFEVTYIK